jgi:hypothetical protein
MKKKIAFKQILENATKLDANNFAKYLDENKINWTVLDCNIMDYNEGYFNINLDDYADEPFLFVDGQYIV